MPQSGYLDVRLGDGAGRAPTSPDGRWVATPSEDARTLDHLSFMVCDPLSALASDAQRRRWSKMKALQSTPLPPASDPALRGCRNGRRRRPLRVVNGTGDDSQTPIASDGSRGVVGFGLFDTHDADELACLRHASRSARCVRNVGEIRQLREQQRHAHLGLSCNDGDHAERLCALGHLHVGRHFRWFAQRNHQYASGWASGRFGSPGYHRKPRLRAYAFWQYRRRPMVRERLLSVRSREIRGPIDRSVHIQSNALA